MARRWKILAALFAAALVLAVGAGLYVLNEVKDFRLMPEASFSGM